MNKAIEALLAYRQADEDGVMVLASRQAIHEVIAHIKELEAENEQLLNMLGIQFEKGVEEGLEKAALEAESWFKEEYTHGHALIKISEIIAVAIRALKEQT